MNGTRECPGRARIDGGGLLGERHGFSKAALPGTQHSKTREGGMKVRSDLERLQKQSLTLGERARARVCRISAFK
jgi:hypothetical protein